MQGKIKELISLEDFKNIYMVFSEPPYNEKYANEELEGIFREYQENGYMYGIYNDTECVGLIALERGIKNDQPVKFAEDEKIIYLADVAVLSKYRRQGLGNQLMLYAVMQSKLLGYDRLYMRTLENGSMSYSIASKIGFKQIPNLTQGVERERIDGTVQTMQNIFLEIDLNSLDRETMSKIIQLTSKTKNNNKTEIEL